jgi:heme/copper-type cytochrome/quinol oxidase subunit 2
MNLLITGILWWDGKILAENYEQENDHDLSQIINNIVGITIIVLVSVVTFVYIMTVFFISIERAKSAEF